jgi:hypothetical protein
MKVRAKALSKFGKNSISKGVPMAMLEDVTSLSFHRYQVEAATKVIEDNIILAQKVMDNDNSICF